MSFLSTLAQHLISTYGTDLSQVTVVFPNKRASLFLNEELVQLSDRPLWSPAYITISDLFRSLSDLQVADPIKLVCDLHKSFVHCTGSDTSLDHFYGWGQLLLSDFDDVDKHLAPADKVFANLRDIHEFDDDTYLTQQQRDIIRKFFSNFNEGHNSELKQRFLSLWSHLGDIYHDFNARLAAQGLAYEGALYREVVTTLAKDSVVPLKKHSARGGTPSQDVFERDYTVLNQEYVFAGFNLLHPVEQALIDSFGTKAKVIQDTDEETPKHITFISATTENSQARYVATWLKENDRIQAGRKTAIVLADETLLQTVIHCLPPEVSKVNITTGYPLSQTATVTQGDWLSQGALGGSLLPDSRFPFRKHSCVPPVASGIAERRTGGTPSQDVFERKDLSTFRIGGIIDRLDKITLPDGSTRIRVVDYKTGSGRLRPLPNIASIFDPANLKNHSDYYLQTILYAIIIKGSNIPFENVLARRASSCGMFSERNITSLPVSPCLLFIQHAGTDDYDPTLLIGNTPVTDINEVKDEFLQHLNTLLTEIFDPDTPFLPTEEGTRCKSCPFHSLCGI